jgi:hypothetical protein
VLLLLELLDGTVGCTRGLIAQVLQMVFQSRRKATLPHLLSREALR